MSDVAMQHASVVDTLCGCPEATLLPTDGYTSESNGVIAIP